MRPSLLAQSELTDILLLKNSAQSIASRIWHLSLLRTSIPIRYGQVFCIDQYLVPGLKGVGLQFFVSLLLLLDLCMV